MQFIVEDKKDLVKKIALNIKAIEKNVLISSLSNIKLEVLDSMLILTSFDGNNCVVSKVAIKNIANINRSIMVDSANFKNIIDRLPDDSNIKFELLDTSELSIKSGRTKLKMKTILDTTDFSIVPTVEEFNEYKSVAFDKQELMNAVSNVSKCSSINNTQPILQAVNIIVEEESADIFCLDGYRLGMNVVECSGSEAFKILVSATKLNEVLKDVAFSDADVVELKTNGKYVLIQSGDVTIFMREIQGSVAPYKRLLTKNYLYEILANKDELNWVLKTSMMVTNNDNKLVRLIVKPEESLIEFKSSGDIITDLSNEIDVEFITTEESELEIAFNATYLLDLIKCTKSKQVKIYFKDSISPVFIENEEGEDETYLVLPVRVSHV